MSITVSTDSYISVDDADTYFAARLESGSWDDATDDNQERALKQATRLLDQSYDWFSLLTDEDQALGWPRQGVYDCEIRLLDEDTIPTQVENATCELAIYLLDGNTADRPVLLGQGFKRAKVGPIEIEADRAFTPETIPEKVALAVTECLGVLKSSGKRTFR